MDSNRYQETLDYLYTFVDYSLTRSQQLSPDKFDLGRMFELMNVLGNPEQNYPSLHIAGTKGKGSVAALCQSALQAEGYKTGLYTSPHLHDYAERIQIDGQPIPHAELVDLVGEIKPFIQSIERLTTFEITTALALVYFSLKKVDVAVVEVGLGGRLDATNVITPVVCVITSLSYDHTAILGDTLAEIAGEKAGIIKPGVPVVLAPQKEEARQVIQQVAALQNAHLVQIGIDYQYSLERASLDRQTFRVWPVSPSADLSQARGPTRASGLEPDRLEIGLLGNHQVENAATAYAALQALKQHGLHLSREALREGFARAVWPGRFEVLQRKPAVIIDSAHNRDSALKLRLTVEEYFPGEKVVLIFGASEDKDLDGMFAELMPIVEQVVATQSYHPRAMEIEKIAAAAHQSGKAVTIVPDVAKALEEALDIAAGKKIVLTAGSIFVAAGVREAWFARQGAMQAGGTGVNRFGA